MNETLSKELEKLPVSKKLTHQQIIITMVGTMLAMFLASLDQTVVSTAMPRIVVDLGGFYKYTWVSTTYIIVAAVSTPIVGKLTDIYSRKIFLVSGLMIFVAASLLCGLSQNMTQLIIFRGVQAIGAASMMTIGFIIIGDMFDQAERGKWAGYLSGVFALSSVVGPSLGGLLTDTLSWHWVFFINIPLGLLTIILFMKFFPDVRTNTGKGVIDYLGLSALILAVIPLMLALQTGGSEFPWISLPVIGSFIFAAIMAVLFVILENKAREPILPLILFKNRMVTVSLILGFLTQISFFGILSFIPLYLQGVFGTSAMMSGNLLIPLSLASTVGSLVAGQLVSRLGGRYRLLGFIAFLIMGLGMFLLSRINVRTSQVTIIFDTSIYGLGVGITFPLITLAIQNTIAKNLLGVGTSAVGFFRMVGGSVGLATFGAILNSRFAAKFLSSTPENINSIVPPNTLTSLANNPRALISHEAQSQLQTILNSVSSQGASLYEQLMRVLREVLASSIAEIFLISFGIVVIEVLITFFLFKEKQIKNISEPLPK